MIEWTESGDPATGSGSSATRRRKDANRRCLYRENSSLSTSVELRQNATIVLTAEVGVGATPDRSQ